MFSFFGKKARLPQKAFKRTVFMAVPLVLAGLLFASCEQAAGKVSDPVNAAKPSITRQPSGGTWDVSEKGTFELSVTAAVSGGGTLSYQWYSNASNSTTGGTATGTNSATLTLNKTGYTVNGTYYFYVIVTNTIPNNGDGGNKTATAVSAAAAVTVVGGVSLVNADVPGIETQPEGGTWDVNNEDSFELTVEATSPDGGELSYQWYSNTSNTNSGGEPIDGADSATLTLSKTDYTENGDRYFYAVVTNTIEDNDDGGNKTATATSNVATVQVSGNGGVYLVNAGEPVIETVTGGNWNVSSANTFTLTVTAASPDGGTLGYRWYSNSTNANTGGTIMSGKTDATLTLNKTDYPANVSYYFYAEVTNTIAAGSNVGHITATKAGNVATVTVTGSTSLHIYSQADMEKIGVADGWTLSETYVLANDITLVNFSPVGGDNPFTGVFNGNNKTITLQSFDDKPVGSILVYSELGTTTPTNPTTQNKVFLGIFGSVQGTSATERAEVKNLKIHSSVLATVNEDAGTAAGLVAGYAKYAVIDNITLSGTFTFTSGSGKSAYVGGVAGVIRTEGTLVTNCTSSMDMDIKPGYGTPLIFGLPNPFSYVGGFVGYMEDKTGIENCHNTGDVKGISSTSGSQVMVGGILGGTYYAFSNSYHGWVADCSSKGDITVGAMGFWPMAGGIAGVICGGHGTLEGSTRIVRCFAEGTITNASTSNTNWPYIGGIVGYVYYGAWVSQAYFNGTVTGLMGYDYTGGIAGYSSYATGGSATQTCVIEDCWSDGTVTGRNNAGGIVGQNQQNTLLRRSYSRMAVHITNGATSSAAQYGTGGIVGSHSSTNPDDAMLACVALNRSITAVKTTSVTERGSEIHRIAGRAQLAGTVFPKMTNVYALADLVPEIEDEGGNYIADKGTDRPDGADIPAGYMFGGKPTQAFYQFIGWDFNTVWKMGSDGYPKLQWQKN